MVLCSYLTLPAEWSDHCRIVAGKFPVALESGLQLKPVGETSQIKWDLNFHCVSLYPSLVPAGMQFSGLE